MAEESCEVAETQQKLPLLEKLLLSGMVLFASAIAFFGTCAPVGTVAFFVGFSFYPESNETRAQVGYYLMIAAFITGTIAGPWVGYLVGTKLVRDWHTYNKN